jgi:protein TonB
MSWIKSSESKGVFFSLLIHSTLLTILLMCNDKPIKLADKEKIVSIDLISYQPAKPKIIEKQEPKPEPKKVEKPKPKPIKKEEPKHKPIVHKKQEPKPEPIKKELKEIVKDIVKPESMQPNKQAFIKTNFAIIRDMVLSNLKYPSIAKRMGWQGIVEVKLVIDKNGKLTHYNIVKSSGKKHLDQSALKAVESIAKKDLPKPNSITTIILPIGFKLQ